MKAKRTFNLPEETLDWVKRAVEKDHLASSQDALVEMALNDLRVAVRGLEAAKLWEQARNDPEWVKEVEQIDKDLEHLYPKWPPY